MEQSSCEDETQAVFEAGGGGWHFRAVGDAVKQGEHADDSYAKGDRKPGGGGDEEAEDEDRGGDGLFGPGYFKTTMAEDSADGHHADEGGGHQPAGATAELRGPEADGDHSKDMVTSAEWMSEATAEIPAKTLVAIMTGMSASDGGYGR